MGELDQLSYRVRQLCAQVIAAEGEEFEKSINELRTCIRKHAQLTPTMLRDPEAKRAKKRELTTVQE